MPEAPAQQLVSGIEHTAIAQALREWQWLFPSVETVHIVGFVLLAGGVILFDLRVLGVGRGLPVDDLARLLLPCSVSAFVLLSIPTGILLFMSDATSYVGNTAFVVKLCLIFVAACNAVAFHLGPYQSVASWRVNASAPFAAKAHAAASILLWLSVICCGRLIAYV